MPAPFRKRPSDRAALAVAIATIVLALVIGLLVGAFAAQTAPKDKFSWASLAFIPVWLLVELLLEIAGGVLSIDAKRSRIPVAVALIGGFHVAWLAVRPWQ